MMLSQLRPEREVRHAGPPARGRRRPVIAVLLLAGVVLAALARFVLAGSGDPTAATRPVHESNTTPAQIARAQSVLRVDPKNADALTALAVGYLSMARQTADPTYYTKADEAFQRSARLRPNDLRTTIGLALLANYRHDFAGSLALGRRAAGSDPASADAEGVIVDAQVELGQYAAAAVSVQRMIDLKPTLASYARVSYLRELLGDTSGAISAMTSAVVAGAGSAADVAYVQALLGDLLRGSGQLTDAAAAYQQALRKVPAYGPAEVGIARIEAARGQLAAAAARLQAVATRLPLPDTIALYGDVLTALGRPAAAAQQYDLVRTIERLQQANGVRLDFESARFEADHARDPGARTAGLVSMARTALAARPTLYAHDVLGWALRQVGQPAAALSEADAALRYGTRDALLYYHRAVIEADLGRTAAARSDLGTAFGINPALTVRDLPAARALAGRLGVRVPATTG